MLKVSGLVPPGPPQLPPGPEPAAARPEPTSLSASHLRRPAPAAAPSGQRRGPWRVVWGALTPFFEPPAPVHALGQRARLARGLGETRIASSAGEGGICGETAAQG